MDRLDLSITWHDALHTLNLNYGKGDITSVDLFHGVYHVKLQYGTAKIAFQLKDTGRAMLVKARGHQRTVPYSSNYPA